MSYGFGMKPSQPTAKAFAVAWFIDVRGQRDDDHVRGGRIVPDRPGGVPTVDARHAEIHQDHGGFALADESKGRLAVGGLNDRKPPESQVFGQHFAAIREVVHDEDIRLR